MSTNSANDVITSSAPDFYTKTKADNLLNAKATATNVYATTETDNLLNAKATTTTVHTKTEAGNLLNSNASTAALDTKMPWVYDTFLELDAIHTDTLLLKKVGRFSTTHI